MIEPLCSNDSPCESLLNSQTPINESCKTPYNINNRLRLNVSLLNARSVRNQTNDLRDYVTENNIDIFCLTETWLKTNETAIISELVPETHTFHHFPREARNGGGVGIVLSKSFRSIKSNCRKYDYFECIQVDFSHKNKKLCIYVIYRPPNPNFSQFAAEFERFLMDSRPTNENVFYLGDFNIWIDDINNSEARKFTDILTNFDLVNHVSSPTHKDGHTLDLILTKTHCEILGTINVDPVATFSSDHNLISTTLNIGSIPKQEKTIVFRNKNYLNSVDFANKIDSLQNSANQGCEHSRNGICCTCLVSKYRETTSDYFNQKAPIIEKKIIISDSYNSWYNSDIKKAKRIVRKAEKLYRKHKSIPYRDRYQQLLQAKCKLVERTKTSHYGGKIDKCKNDSKKLHDVLNNLLGKNTKDYVLPQHESDFNLAQNFKNFFLSKITRLKNSFDVCISSNNTSLIPTYPLDQQFDTFAEIEKSEILKILKKMNKTFCSNDPFDIRSFDFDQISEPLAIYLCKIVNSSFNEGKFPETEKFACVRPKIKGSSDPDELSSYRPLYNTSILSKVLESAALSQLLAHLKKFESFSKVQSAYREFHSVETAMCKIYNDLIIRKCEGNCTLLVLLDLSAAFDTVDQKILIDDLTHLGIGGKVLNWFYSFLNKRNFKVIIGKEMSDSGEMTTGVPQGSILGPVLFTIYTIELYYLLQSLDVESHFYADDTQIYFSVQDPDQARHKFREVYSAVEQWMYKRKLKLNSGKTEIMLVGSQSRINLLSNFKDMTVGTSTVTLSEKVRSLGIIVDQNLTLKQQLKNTKRKAINNLMNISRISKYINKPSRMKLVYGLVFSVIDFCNSLYYDLPDSDLHGLQMIINSAARIVKSIPRFSRNRITPVCIELHFLPLKARIIYKICLITYKALNFNQPKYIAELIKEYTPETNMSLRSIDNNRLDEPVISPLQAVDRCFQHASPRLYNALPNEVRQASTVQSFKKMLKKHLFKKAYNTEAQRINSMYRV